MWEVHSQCPHGHCGLAIISELLTAVGGVKRCATAEVETEEVVSWKKEEKKWVEVLPPMSTARKDHAVVSDDRYVVAAGGDGKTSVELFTVSSNTWSTLTHFQRPLRDITATLCGDRVYAMSSKGETYSIPLPQKGAYTDMPAERLSDAPTKHSPDKPEELPSDTRTERPLSAPAERPPDAPIERTQDTPTERRPDASIE